jgi:hypothetical protein
MDLPTEMRNIIISFVPQSRFLTVCKDWKNQIKNIQKKSANIIGSWYKKRISVLGSKNESVIKIVRYYVIHCPEIWFIDHPEYIVSNLGLTEELLTVLPPITNRKRSEVRDWLINIPIDIEDWKWIVLTSLQGNNIF